MTGHTQAGHTQAGLTQSDPGQSDPAQTRVGRARSSRWIVCVALPLLAVLVVGTVGGCKETRKAAAVTTATVTETVTPSTTTVTSALAPAPTEADTDTSEVEVTSPETTVEATAATSTHLAPTGASSSGQRNALAKADAYLEMSGFSYSGLVEQLEYEGFSTADATYAADNCGADWTA